MSSSGLGLVVVVVLVLGAGFAAFEVRAFNASMAKVYDVPAPAITRSTEPAVLARGKHVADRWPGARPPTATAPTSPAASRSPSGRSAP